MSTENNKKRRRREEIDSNVIVINDYDDEIDGNSVVDTTLHDDDNKRSDQRDRETNNDTEHISTYTINNTTVENNDMTNITTNTSSSSNKESAINTIIQSPTTFVTWNCNGFISRCTWDRDKLLQLVIETNYPDIICIQEVRLKCDTSTTRNIPCNDDYHKHVKNILNDKLIFGNYTIQQFSLANTRYAGTLTLFHQRLNISQIYINNHSAYTFYTAIKLLQSYYIISIDQLTQIIQNLQSNNEEFEQNTSPTTIVTTKFLEPSTLTSCLLNGSIESKSTSVNRSTDITRKSQKQQQLPHQTTINSFFTIVPNSDTNTKKQPPKKQQTKIQSFFTKMPKNKVSSVESLSDTLPSKSTTTRTTSPIMTTIKSTTCIQEHTEHGRFQFFILPNIDLINTYVPNNGNKLESYQRREIWDNDMYNFLLVRQSIIMLHQERQQQQQQGTSSRQLSSSSSSATTSTSTASRPLLWCGDLNCALDYRDGTHWSPIKKNPSIKETISESSTNGTTGTTGTTGTIVAASVDAADIYEWWTDEKKCFVIPPRRDKKTFHLDNYGMPSFTSGERRRFITIIYKFNFIDIWRHLYPTGTGNEKKENDNNSNDSSITNAVEECVDNNSSNKRKSLVHTNNSSLHPWDRPDYTWRGHLSVEKGSKDGMSENSKVMAKYEGKGQRIDYFLMTGCFDMMPVNGDQHNNNNTNTCIMSIVERCEILGYGSNRDGLFCGSDHCASILQLKENWFC